MSLISSIFFSFFLCTILSAYGLEGGAGCDFNETIPEADFKTLLQRIKNTHSDSGKIETLKSFLANSTKGFGGLQTAELVQLFSFSTSRVQAISISKKWILGMNCSEVANLLRKIKFSSDKMEILSVVSSFINDIKYSNQSIIDEFEFSSGKEDALEILKNAKPRTCTWGELDLERFDFIIDTSGSMDTKFNYFGKMMTRLQFVQMELETALATNILPTQQFNIIQFATSAASWQPGVVNATKENILLATQYAKKLRADGYTNMGKALQLAMSDPRVLGVYFLSDGEPSDGNAVLLLGKKWGKPVNTIAFKANNAAANFLLNLAKETGGRFRSIK